LNRLQVSIFISLELRKTISEAGITAADVVSDLNEYSLNPAITAKWDSLQSDLHCCGGNSFLIGYNDYRFPSYQKLQILVYKYL
jgi:hypothetical protein